MLDFSQYFFECLLAIAIAGLCFALFMQRAEMRRLRALIRCERADRESLSNDVAALLSCSQTIGARVRSQNRTQSDLIKKIDVLDHNQAPVVQPTYERVHKLVTQGLNVAEIADICDLARGEVELLSHMAEHRSAA